MTAILQRHTDSQHDADRRGALRHPIKLVGHAIAGESASIAVIVILDRNISILLGFSEQTIQYRPARPYMRKAANSFQTFSRRPSAQRSGARYILWRTRARSEPTCVSGTS